VHKHEWKEERIRKAEMQIIIMKSSVEVDSLENEEN
jgi:hypothetical protein